MTRRLSQWDIHGSRWSVAFDIPGLPFYWTAACLVKREDTLDPTVIKIRCPSRSLSADDCLRSGEDYPPDDTGWLRSGIWPYIYLPLVYTNLYRHRGVWCPVKTPTTVWCLFVGRDRGSVNRRIFIGQPLPDIDLRFEVWGFNMRKSSVSLGLEGYTNFPLPPPWMERRRSSTDEEVMSLTLIVPQMVRKITRSHYNIDCVRVMINSMKEYE